MALNLTADDAKQSLTAHVAARGAEVHARFGPRIGWSELLLMLQDRACVRYPCDVVFDASRLRAGEFAHAEQKGAAPEDGFTMFVHPLLMTDLSRATFAVLYQLVVVNYGEFASSDDAETFGAAVLGIDMNAYYDVLCSLADEIAEAEGC